MVDTLVRGHGHEGLWFIAFLRGAVAEPFTRPVVELCRNAITVVLREVLHAWPLGRYWRIRPLVFSLVPRSHAWWGVAN